MTNPETLAGAVPIRTALEMRVLMNWLAVRPPMLASLVTLASYSRVTDETPSGREQRWVDIVSCRPGLWGITFADGVSASNERTTIVLDTRAAAVRNGLVTLLRQAPLWVVHDLRATLPAVCCLGLEAPSVVHDLSLGERIQELGRFHPRYAETLTTGGASERLHIERRLAAERGLPYDLPGLAFRYGIRQEYLLVLAKNRTVSTQELATEPFPSLVRAAADGARALLELYAAQQSRLNQAGLSAYFRDIEMPFALCCFRTEWLGLRASVQTMAHSTNMARDDVRNLGKQMKATWGIDKPESDAEVAQHLDRVLGLRKRVSSDSGMDLDDHLKGLEVLSPHPAVSTLRRWRMLRNSLRGGILSGEYLGQDGRFHPGLRALGTDTGRVGCSRPNVIGLPAIFRPIIIADDGMAIVEVDIAQQEAGILAAVSGDEQLLRRYNDGDLYEYLAGLLRHVVTQNRSDAAQHAGRIGRQQGKVVLLALQNGFSAQGLAHRLGWPLATAKQFVESFFARHRVMDSWRTRVIAQGRATGFSSTLLGLRRYRGRIGPLNQWERNFLVNMAIQGTAADLLKIATIRVAIALEELGGRVLLSRHDSLLIQAPKKQVRAAVDIAGKHLVAPIIERFPQLRMRFEVQPGGSAAWGSTDYS